MKKKTARVKRVGKLCENQENFEPAELSDSLRALSIPAQQRQLKQLQQVTSSAFEGLPLQATRNDSTSIVSSRSPRGRRRIWTRLRTTRTPRYRKMGRRRGRTRTRTRPSKLSRRSTSSRKPSVRTYASHSDTVTGLLHGCTLSLMRCRQSHAWGSPARMGDCARTGQARQPGGVEHRHQKADQREVEGARCRGEADVRRGFVPACRTSVLRRPTL